MLIVSISLWATGRVKAMEEKKWLPWNKTLGIPDLRNRSVEAGLTVSSVICRRKGLIQMLRTSVLMPILAMYSSKHSKACKWCTTWYPFIHCLSVQSCREQPGASPSWHTQDRLPVYHWTYIQKCTHSHINRQTSVHVFGLLEEVGNQKKTHTRPQNLLAGCESDNHCKTIHTVIISGVHVHTADS